MKIVIIFKVIVYGKQVAREIARAKLKPKRIWCKRSTYEFAKEHFTEVEIRVVHPKVISSICKSQDHQGIAIEIDINIKRLEDIRTNNEKSTLILLDRVQDVGNIGNIIRTGEFFGCAGIILTENETPNITPAAIKASAGAFFHIPIIKEKSENIMMFLKGRGLKIYSFDVRGDLSIFDVKFEKPAVLCFGGEEKGISEEILKSSDAIIKIPRFGKIDSLNVASSVAVSLGIYIFQIRKT